MAEPLPDVADLLPQQPPMRLLDRVTGWTEGRVEACVAVCPSASFFEQGRGIPSWVGMEYLGQAAAAWFALTARGTHPGEADTPPRPGLLVACRRYQTPIGYFPPDCVLTIAVWPASALSAALVKFEGDIRWGSWIVRGELSVYMDSRPTGVAEVVP